MKSPAPKQFAILAAMLILAGECLLASGQSNQCKCAEPPGGTVTCEEGQIPICIVKDGKVTSNCKSLPENHSRNEVSLSQRHAWLLSVIMGKEVTVAELKQNQEYQKALLEGRSISAQSQISFLPLGPSIKDLQLSSTVDVAYIRSPLEMKMRPFTNPNHEPLGKFEALYRKGEVLLDLKDYVEALTAFQAARLGAIENKSQTQLSSANEGIGLSCHGLRRYDEAAKALQEAASLAPNDPDLLHELGTTLRSATRYLEAAEAFEKAIKLRPDNFDSHASLGFVLYELRKYVEAEQALMNAVRLRPESAEAYATLGLAFYSEHKYAEASEAFKRTVQLRPDDTTSYVKLGTSLYQLGQYAAAENAFKLAIRLKPDSAVLYGELGRVLYTQLKYPEAALAFKQATLLDPSKVYFHIGLGDALYAQGQNKNAQAEYRLALDLDPKNSIFQHRLVQAGAIK